jgi:hypothetical protein
MKAIIASTYGWDFYLLFAGWPALNWLTALSALIPVVKKSASSAWLVLAVVPFASALWLVNNFLRFGGPSPETWHIAGFFSPALIGILGAVVIARRAIARRSLRDEKKA